MKVSERGSGTVLILVAVIFGGFLIVVCLTLADAILARHRASAAADLAALAAAGEWAGPGAGSGACDQARRVAETNGAQLEECRPLADGSVRVTVTAELGGGRRSGLLGSARARARAGPGWQR
jgi:secretion/DNA translocation related TadE-like protein